MDRFLGALQRVPGDGFEQRAEPGSTRAKLSWASRRTENKSAGGVGKGDGKEKRGLTAEAVVVVVVGGTGRQRRVVGGSAQSQKSRGRALIRESCGSGLEIWQHLAAFENQHLQANAQRAERRAAGSPFGAGCDACSSSEQESARRPAAASSPTVFAKIRTVFSSAR